MGFPDAQCKTPSRFFRRLAHDFRLTDHGALVQAAGEKRPFESEGIFGGKFDVEKKPHRASSRRNEQAA
jgi:hypothetical protein